MAASSTHNHTILGLDVGDVRIGIAIAGSIARIPNPIETVIVDDNTLDLLSKIITRESASKIVIGIPRNLSGDETPQTSKIRQFAEELKQHIEVPIVFVDESLSSKRADTIIGEKKVNAPQDSVAACFILQEYFDTLETL